ncbi:hypothetical protein [Desulfosediminicola sp.]|uniref:hypothetical protein n=1 Tax=Desulfosediminicola sp. TaxID=2886825 RepID=UPI003AF20BF7
MLAWITENILTLIFGTTTLILAVVNLRYRIRDHNLRAETSLTAGSRISVFFSRESMVKYLLEMYNKAEADDLIWGQCVGCSNYSPDVRAQVSSAASRGVNFQVLLNSRASSSKELESLYTPYRNAKLAYRDDNLIRLQGLGRSEVVLAFPSLEAYSGIVIKEQHLVEIFFSWFDERFKKGEQVEPVVSHGLAEARR